MAGADNNQLKRGRHGGHGGGNNSSHDRRDGGSHDRNKDCSGDKGSSSGGNVSTNSGIGSGRCGGNSGRKSCRGIGGNSNSCVSGSGMINHVWVVSGCIQSRWEEIVPQIVPE
jgi:hypothetical protein